LNLRIPGPVPLPDAVLKLVGSQMINHRGSLYAEILERIIRNLSIALATDSDICLMTSSGTGVMEAALVNTLSPGDRVLAVSIGTFGDRFGEIAAAYGADVDFLRFPLGQAADPVVIRDRVRSDSGLDAVLMTHNESSTAVTNPIDEISLIIREESDALVLVDAVSSAGGVPLETDAWGIDVVATASQKSWSAPPGIGMLAFGERAWGAYKKARMPRYYLDVAQYRDFQAIGQPPFTPALPTIFGLDSSLQAMVDEGMQSVFARHHARAEQTRTGVKRLGLELFPDEKVASDTVTGVRVPDGVDGKELLVRVLNDHHVALGGGQESLTGKIFRIGHMGWVEPEHIDDVLLAVAKFLGRVAR